MPAGPDAGTGWKGLLPVESATPTSPTPADGFDWLVTPPERLPAAGGIDALTTASFRPNASTSNACVTDASPAPANVIVYVPGTGNPAMRYVPTGATLSDADCRVSAPFVTMTETPPAGRPVRVSVTCPETEPDPPPTGGPPPGGSVPEAAGAAT